MRFLPAALITVCVFFVFMTVASARDDESQIIARVDRIINSATENIVAERWDDAVKDFEEVLKLGVKLPDKIYYHYGNVLFKAGNYEKSLTILNTYIKLAGRNGEFYQKALDLIMIAGQKQEEHIPEAVREQIEKNMVFIKGGCFKMGNAFKDGNEDEEPVHKVCVDDFYLGKYEVTVGEFRAFVHDTGYRTEAERGDGMHYWSGSEWERKEDIYWDNTGFPQEDRQPVVGVSWNDTQEFIKWLNKGFDGKIHLPTEAEWEYAARSGGKKYKYSWGNGRPSGNVAEETTKRVFPSWPAWQGYDDGFLFTAPVGSFEPNELGLYDMTGNVWEWCSDWYDKEYYKQKIKHNPKGPSSGLLRVNRGSCWHCGPEFNRITFRSYIYPDYRFITLGFRLAKTP